MKNKKGAMGLYILVCLVILGGLMSFTAAIPGIASEPSNTLLTTELTEEIEIGKLQQSVYDQGHNYTVAENWITRLSPEDRNALCGYKHLTAPTEPLPENVRFVSDVPKAKAKAETKKFGAAPSSYDAMALGYVTPVKNQGACGSCWIFGATTDFESSVAIAESNLFDFSEQEVGDCNIWSRVGGYNFCDGGNAFMTSNYFTKNGSADEACHLYAATPQTCQNCSILKNVDNWRMITGADGESQITIIKNAILTYGPVYSTIYASDPGFGSYSGGVYEYWGTESPNHAIEIIGWNDSIGAWMIKNSWGTDWGASGPHPGCAWVAYGAANLGDDTSAVASYKNPGDVVFYRDECGWMGWCVGYGSTTSYGAVRFIPSQDLTLTAVDFWAVDADMQYEIKIFDTLNDSGGGNYTFSDQLGVTQTGTTIESGYYSIPLDTPVQLVSGDDFIVQVKLTTTGYGYPIPIDYCTASWLNWAAIATSSGESYASCDGSQFEKYGEDGIDIGIRARAETAPPGIFVPDDYLTIQEAVNAASPGDTIIVRDGTYNENVDVGVNNLTVRSENGFASTIVNASDSSDHVFEVIADYVNIKGFTVENATEAGSAGIYLNNVTHCNIRDNNATGNSIGIYLNSSSNNLIYNNYFDNTNNNAYDDGNNIWNSTKIAGTNIVGGSYLGGNYWSDYAGTDMDGDGLGDTLLPYNSSANITIGGDWSPLTELDLTVNISSPRKNLLEGDSITVNVTVHNSGNGLAASVSVSLYDEYKDITNLVGSKIIPRIVVNGSNSTNLTWVVPITGSILDGYDSLETEHRLRVVIDPNHKIPETNESNNNVSVAILVRKQRVEDVESWDNKNITNITYISTWNILIKNTTLTLRNAELAMKPVVHWDIMLEIGNNGTLVLDNSSINTTKRMALVMHENASLIVKNNSNISMTVLKSDSTGKFIFSNSSFDNRDAECNWTVSPLNPEEHIHTKITGNNITISKSRIYSDRDLEIQGTGNKQIIEISDTTIKTTITGSDVRAGTVDGHNLSNNTYKPYPQIGALVLNGSNISLSDTGLSSNILFIYGNVSGVLNLSGSKMDIKRDVVIGDPRGYFEKIQINDTEIKNHAYDITIYCEGTLDSNDSLFSASDYIFFTNDNGSINISDSELTSAQRNINLSTENGSINISNSELTSAQRNINLVSSSMVIHDSQLKAPIYPETDGYRVNVSGDVEIINTTIHDILTDVYYSPYNGFDCEYTNIRIADNNSTANASWYVDVVVKDLNGRFVEGANITLYNRVNQSYSYTSGTTDARGYARLIALTETMKPPYKTHFVGNLNLEVSYGSEQIDPAKQILLRYSTEKPLEITIPTVILHDKQVYDDFDGEQINESIWYSKTFGSCTVNDSILNVPDGNELQSLNTFQYAAVEMRLKSSSVPATNITQMWGLGDGANWVDFGSHDGRFMVRSYNSSSEIEKVYTFTIFNITEWHTYKIVRTPNTNRFYIDDEYIARQNIELSSANMFLRFYSVGDNLSVDWINVTVDTTPPIFTALYPLDGSQIADNMTEVYANYSDDWSGLCSSSVTITIDGVDVKKNANVTSSFVLYQPQEQFNDGIYLVNVTVSDNQGNRNSTNWSFTVEALPPTITITSPINSTTYNNSSINLNYSVNEETIGEGYSLDGAANVTLTGNTTLINLTGGIHNVIVYANDTAGKTNSSIVWFTVITSASNTFDTGAGTYPSIMGIHKGNFTPSNDLTVNRMYTYPRAGTGGHSEYVEFRNDTWSVEANWTSYGGDWHYIIFNASFTLKANENYHYTIHTGSYPQIIHKQNHTTLDGSVITCSEFVDANGKIYEDWIPAVRLEYHE